MSRTPDPRDRLTPPRKLAEPSTVDGGGTSKSDGPSLLPPVAGRSIGDYELLGEIERGGMGIVYRAHEQQSGQLVALKMMLGESAVDSADLQRFILEARATGELSHPGVVSIHAWGLHEGHPFYTMDFVPGVTLGRLLESGPLPVAQAVHLMLGIARAVAAAHALGIVHRDLKPGNVMIDPTGQPRILDFGLAKRRPTMAEATSAEENWQPVVPLQSTKAPETATATPQHLTEKGAILGTPSYMAPEQARGELNRIGPAADVHALGAMLFEMLTGRPPFQGATTMETLMQVLDQPAADVRSLRRAVPDAVAKVCRRCLVKDPAQRYAEAGALADDLERRWRRHTESRRFARLALIAGLAVGLLAGFEWLMGGNLGLDVAFLSRLARDHVPSRGGMVPAAEMLGLGIGLVTLHIVPLLARVVFLCWFGAWVWYTERYGVIALLCLVGVAMWGVATWEGMNLYLAWYLVLTAFVGIGLAVVRALRLGRTEEREAPAGEADPYLHRLFGVRGHAKSERVAVTSTAGVVEMTDVELGKTLHRSDGCAVSRARQRSLDRPVLVWQDLVPRPAGAPAPGVDVRHPAVLSLHAVILGSESTTLITEPVAATSLADLLERGPLPPVDAVGLVIRLANALQAFHDQGVVHGRLRAEWILVRGDLEAVLCPCGVPSQAPAQQAADVHALGELLHEWLPPRDTGWQRHARAVLYRIADDARRGVYIRAEDLARDLENGLRLTRVRFRERLAHAVALGLYLGPWLLLVGSMIVSATANDGAATATLVELSRQVPSSILPLLSFSIMLLGFTDGRAFLQRLRLRLHGSGRVGLPGLRPALLGRLGIAMLLPAVWAAFGPSGGEGSRLLTFIASLGLLLGFWFFGTLLAGVVTFAERSVRGLWPRAFARKLPGPSPTVGASPANRAFSRTFGAARTKRHDFSVLGLESFV